MRGRDCRATGEALSSDGGTGWLGASLRCRTGGDAPASLRHAVRYRLGADAGLVARFDDFAAAPTAAVQRVSGDGERKREQSTVTARARTLAKTVELGAKGFKPSSPSRPRRPRGVESPKSLVERRARRASINRAHLLPKATAQPVSRSKPCLSCPRPTARLPWAPTVAAYPMAQRPSI